MQGLQARQEGNSSLRMGSIKSGFSIMLRFSAAVRAGSSLGTWCLKALGREERNGEIDEPRVRGR